MRTSGASPICLLLAASLLVGCGGGGTRQDDRPLVVVTTSVLGDLVAMVTGSEAEVEVLMPRGTDPHGFSPSPRQVASIREAALVVANGLGLEEGLTDALATVRDEGRDVLEIAPEVDPVPLEDGEGLDPHVWLDPVRMADAMRAVARRLDRIAPGGWEARAEKVARRLHDLDDEIRGILDPIPGYRRLLVTNHEALGYFAARYDLEVIGTVIPSVSTLGQPSAGGFAELAALIRERDVTAIFAETTQPVELAESLAAEVGRPVKVVELFTESLGPPGSGAGTYAGMLRTDARRIAEALG